MQRQTRTIPVPVVVVVALAIHACTSKNPQAPAGDRSGTADAIDPISSPATTPADPSYGVMQRVCAHPCAGLFARVQVFRDPAGAVERLRFDGDVDACSHPPRIYFDATGTETLVIPNQPVAAGSAEAEAWATKQAAQTEGLVEAEGLSCFAPEGCAPARIEGFTSSYPCRADSDCAPCACAPVNREEFERRGGPPSCNIDGEECTATNAVCCGGRCALAR